VSIKAEIIKVRRKWSIGSKTGRFKVREDGKI